MTAPGQGAQTPGFLAPWLELPGVAERLGAASELAGCDLIKFGTTANADEIRDTAVAQPLLVAAAIVAASALSGGDPGDVPADAAAGHSVGELAAGVIAGVLDSDDAMRLVRVRGTAMAAAAAVEPTGMTAVLGGEAEAVLAAIASNGLTPANVNGSGQIVAAGTLADLEAFAAAPPVGARLRPLQVAGAFHTRHMAPAVDGPARRGRQRPGQGSGDDAAVRRRRRRGHDRQGMAGTHHRPGRRAGALGPVHADHGRPRRDRDHRAAAGRHPDGPGPAGAAGRGAACDQDPRSARRRPRAHRGAPRRLRSPQPWPPAGMAADRGAHVGNVPVAGGARRRSRDRGLVALTADLGMVIARGGQRAVAAPWPAEIIEWLVEDGDPVSEGQPLVRIQPEGGPGGWVPPDRREGA